MHCCPWNGDWFFVLAFVFEIIIAVIVCHVFHVCKHGGDVCKFIFAVCGFGVPFPVMVILEARAELADADFVVHRS